MPSQSTAARAATPRFSAVIFDLDGTLVDSAPDLCGVVNHMLVEHGRPQLDLKDIRKMVGDGAARLIERGFGATGGLPAPLPDLTKRFIEIYATRVAELTRPFPGVIETLTRLRDAGVRLGVCTNKPTGLSRELLDALELSPFFDCLVGGDVPARKPDPRHIRMVMDQLGAEPAATLMVGDSANDVLAARGAGIKVVVVPFGYTSIPPADLGADLVLGSFGELRDFVGV
ncbi:MAG TPA: phosphoglycolate phosphatase [Alphaproteobacteria bacterium]